TSHESSGRGVYTNDAPGNGIRLPWNIVSGKAGTRRRAACLGIWLLVAGRFPDFSSALRELVLTVQCFIKHTGSRIWRVSGSLASALVAWIVLASLQGPN